MPIPEFDEIVDYVNYHYYSKPMTVVNIKRLQIPFPHPLRDLKTPDGARFSVRASHGLLHALSAANLIDKVDEYYSKYVPDYADFMNDSVRYFGIEREKLIQLIKIAVLFHDAGRQGDGMDLWDPASGLACKNYLIEQCDIAEYLAIIIADTIVYKDDKDKYVDKHSSRLSLIDFFRQLVNMADTLEVIRTRHEFKPEFLPLAKYVTPQQMVNEIIPGLIVPHREHIVKQGRFSKKGLISYESKGFRYEDTNFKSNPGKNFDAMAIAYKETVEEHQLSILNINENNLDEVFEKAIRGINTYQNENKVGIKFFHGGFFAPRYHGKTGSDRAAYYERILNDPQTSSAKKLKALYALFASHDGATLQEEVLRSFNQTNLSLVKLQIADLLKNYYSVQNLNTDIKDHVLKANGVKAMI
ncbi:MAG TPA: hypothetical protein PK657_06480 [Legionella sp.]|nr:hypothetical protein [Legionella sp.]